MNKVLMVSRAFPPFLPVGHSIRTVKFVKYLPELGWLPAVLTVNDQHEYEHLRKVGSSTLLSEIPPGVRIFRTKAGERSLEFIEKEKLFGRQNPLTGVIMKILNAGRRWIYRTLLIPDPFILWLPFAIWRGRKIVVDERIDVIFTTCPPYSALLVGVFLKKITGKPLVLDFRDDWIDTPWFHSRHRLIKAIERKLERISVRTADRVILVTDWSQKAFSRRYPNESEKKFVLIPNGCDLQEYEALNSVSLKANNKIFTILHAGSLNDSNSWARTPETLFHALQDLIINQSVPALSLHVLFAGDFPDRFRLLADEMGLADIVQGIGHLSHDEVLALIKSSDLLLAINYEGFSTLIPGKIYEYWAAGSAPILFLSCPGAAQELIEKWHLGTTVLPDDISGIGLAILNFYRMWVKGSPIKISTMGIEDYDRKTLTNKLVLTLSSISPTIPEEK